MRVIVNVQYRDGEQIFSTDLEVPSDACIGDLSRWMAQALNIDDVNGEFEYQYSLLAQGMSDILPETESLASLGLWDGTPLVLNSRRTGRKKKITEKPSSDNKKAEVFFESEARKYAINDSGMWIGRSTPQTSPDVLETLIDLKDEPHADTVSRKHAQIIIKGNEYFLKTLKKNISRTFINEEVLKSEAPRLLQDGDTLKFGAVVLLFKSHDTGSNK